MNMGTMSNNTSLRKTFNNAAGLYNAARPRYPEELFDTLIRTARPGKNSNLLEIGPGTGQATEPLARRGYAITAVELGPALANAARSALKKYPQVRIITGAFEEAKLPLAFFDLVYAASAFHWLRPGIKFTKPHKLLKPSGYLAIISTSHISDEAGDDFFFASQSIYRKYKPGGSFDKNFRLPRITGLKPDTMDNEFFTPVSCDIFPLSIPYTGAGYVRLLRTYSPTLSMPPDNRTSFLRNISRLINAEFGGSIRKKYAFTLTIAKKIG